MSGPFLCRPTCRKHLEHVCDLQHWLKLSYPENPTSYQMIIIISHYDGHHMGVNKTSSLDTNWKKNTTGVPSCLLPGSTNEYLAHFHCSKRMDLELACLVWVYSWHPEADEDEDQDEAGGTKVKTKLFSHD